MEEPTGAHAFEISELLGAFHQQFIERSIEAPPSWSERLAHLARETQSGRRFATIIFVDLVGYTRLSSELSEDKLIALRNRFNALCTNEVARHGGFLIQFLGDAAFAAFGAPWAFERDSESAVRCLLAIRERVGGLGGGEYGLLEIRGGAANGVINVRTVSEAGRLRPDLIGSAVNLAARMQNQARPSEVVVTLELARLVGSEFQFTEGEPFTPKNYPHPVIPCAILGEHRLPVERRNHEVPFIGREEELREVLLRLSDHSPEGVCIEIHGEAGVGKTRFATECLAKTTRAGACFRSTLEPHHKHVLLAPFIQLVRWLAGVAPGENPMAGLCVRFPGLDAATRRALGVAVHDPESLAALANLPARQLRASVEAALIELVTLAAAQGRVYLLFDDLQWADPISCELIDRLADSPPSNLLLLIVRRPEEIADAKTNPRRLTVRLTPLPQEAAQRLLAEVLGTATQALNPLLFKQLVEESGGNPLYLIELALEITGPGASKHSIEELARRLAGTHDLDAHQRLIEIFQARIDRLTHLQRMTLQCGAVLGRRFRESILSGIAEIKENVLEYLAVLKGVRLIREELLPDDREMLFAPPLLRDVAYQMIDGEQRTLLHRRFAALIEERYATRLEELATELAYHWLKAGHYDRAAKWIRKGCQRALRFGLAHEAYALAKDGLEALPENPVDPRTRAQFALLHEEAAKAAFQSQDWAVALSHVSEIESTCRSLGNPIGLFNAMYRRCLIEIERGDLPTALALIDTLVSSSPLQEHRRDELRARILLRQGRQPEALALFLAGAERESTRHPGLCGDNWNNAALCHLRIGAIADACKFFEKADEAYARYGNPLGQALVLNNLGILHQQEGAWAASKEAYQKAADLANRSGYLHGLSAIHANLSYLHYLDGEPTPALDNAARALHFARLIRHPHSEAVALINLALAQELAGQPEAAESTIHAAVEKARVCGDTSLIAEATVESAFIAWRRGHRDTMAQRLADVAIENMTADVAALHGRLNACLAGAAPPPASPQVSAGGVRRLEGIGRVVGGKLDILWTRATPPPP